MRHRAFALDSYLVRISLVPFCKQLQIGFNNKPVARHIAAAALKPARHVANVRRNHVVASFACACEVAIKFRIIPPPVIDRRLARHVGIAANLCERFAFAYAFNDSLLCLWCFQ